MTFHVSDPFEELPAEIRIQVLASMQCQSMILRLIEASPIMLQQYLLYKKPIIRQVLATEFDEDLVQDAMAVILFPLLRDSIQESLAMGPSEAIHSHVWAWTNFQLPDPLKDDNDHLIDELNKLHRKVIALAEDYIAKATSTLPSWAYVCVPETRQSSVEGHLMFKGVEVAPRFNFGKLTTLEKRRFLKAFLTYELLCKASIIRFIPIILSQRKVSYAEFETVACIHEYFCSLYGALFAQCTGLPSVSTERRFPDSFCFDANKHTPKLDFNPSTPFRNKTDYSYDYPAYFSTLGLGYLTRLLQYDMANPAARE
ncbi:hypothetical protein NW752_012021 [Fusarium irregulare]|uniref:Uncharacterized protein n=1 Tax=Fusarium irregulare TaxID=2494466 RepID=A0A9W8U5V3_9HYPO|nr:hypothetical protein NW752_012021 [Fusarium irregulare]KAJ4006374.1 hypothetical protein NW766_010458 [Fusarium irregulare]